jgi:Flp pilus assembly pilin Flp
MRSAWEAFWSEESGQGLLKYALTVALFSIGLIAILLVLRTTCSASPQSG